MIKNEINNVTTCSLGIVDATAIPLDEAVQLKESIISAIQDYSATGKSLRDWSVMYLQQQLPKASQTQIELWADDIQTTLSSIKQKQESINLAQSKGIGIDDWFAKDIQMATSQISSQDAANYIRELDATITTINSQWESTIKTKIGAINQNPNLDGFIAETHHVNSFNSEAAAKSSQYRAEVLGPTDTGYSKNSVDIVIKDGNGKVIRKYQSKYYKDAKSTSNAFDHGNYSSQRKLVPSDQTADIKGSFDRIESPDGTTSKPLSKDDAGKLQSDIQKQDKLPLEDYSSFDNKLLLKQIGGNVAVAGIIGAGMGAAFEIGSKIVSGEEVDAGEVAAAAISGGQTTALETAIACGLKVAIEKSAEHTVLGTLKGTPLAPIVTAVDIGIQNVTTMFKMGSGEISTEEGIKEIECNTVAGVAGAVYALKGMAIGATIGNILGPIGRAVGGFAGGVVGGIAGSSVTRTVVKGTQKVRDIVVNRIKTLEMDIVDTALNVGSAISSRARSFLGNIASMFGF